MNMVWDIRGAAYYEQLWLTVPCSDDSTMFCFHFWRLSGLHVVPFKRCLGGSCILLCAYEREMNFSVPKYCKKGLCKKAACSYLWGKISSLDNVTSCLQNTNVLDIALKCRTRFFMLSRAASSLASKWFFESTVLGEGDFFEAVHMKSSVYFPNFSLLKHEDLMFMDAEPVPIWAAFQWWGARCPCLGGSHLHRYAHDFFILHLQTLCNLKTMQHWRRSNPHTWCRVRMGKSNSTSECRKRDQPVQFLDTKRGMSLIWEMWATMAVTWNASSSGQTDIYLYYCVNIS